MALTGTLRDFGIAEILQLIGTQKKTGILTLEDGKRQAQIEFADGLVIGASGGEETVPLHERLYRSKILTKEQVDSAMKKVEQTLQPLASILVNDNYLEVEIVKSLLVRHNSEIVYEVFDWKSGTYAFQQKFAQYDKQFVTPIPAESIMMEGLRIVDEGPGIRKVIPRLDEVFIRLDKSVIELEQMDKDHVHIFELIDGRSTLKDVILASGLDKFDAMKALSSLRMNRFITLNKEKVEPSKDKIERPQELSKPTLALLYGLSVFTFGVLAAKIIFTIWLFAAPVSEYSISNNQASRILENARLDRVQRALDIYHLRHNKYPDTLDALVNENLIRRSDIKPLGRKILDYEITKTGPGYLIGGEAEAFRDGK